MSLTQQFLLISIFPLSFVGMALYVWRVSLKRRELLRWWVLTLVLAALWASSVLRFYSGATVPFHVKFFWGVIGSYLFSLTAVATLLTTIRYLKMPRRNGRFALGLSAILLLAAAFLDYQIWYRLPDLVLARQTIRQFDLWASVWITSWLIPMLAAWIATRQKITSVPASHYRNQIQYWSLALGLFLMGGVLASIQQPGQPGWQEIGLLTVILAAMTGTISVARRQLPDLSRALRQLFVRLSGTFIVFGLTWLVLAYIVRQVTNLPDNTSPNLILVLAAALFAGFFTLIYRLANEFVRRLFSPSLPRSEMTLSDFRDAVGDLIEPQQLAQLSLKLVHAYLHTNDAWFFVVEDNVTEGSVLRPLASLGHYTPETTTFGQHSLFMVYLRQTRAPLVQHDIETMSDFDDASDTEKTQLTNWKRVLYLPLHAGTHLIGMIALGAKPGDHSYDRDDLTQLQSLAAEISPLLVQVQHVARLRQANADALHKNQTLIHEKQHLEELLNLHTQLGQMVSPQLIKPFRAISQQINQLRETVDSPAQQNQLVTDLEGKLTQLHDKLDRLVAISGRLQARQPICFRPTDLDEVTQKAVRSLTTMAEARRVTVIYDPVTTLPTVLGDADHLQEAIQNLLHNAIKFNKIGGDVRLDCNVNGDHLCLQMQDSGVGIPPERLDTLWQGLTFDDNGTGRHAGLGLTLSQYIIAAHGGRIEVESKYGAGSLFLVYLPIAPERNPDFS